MGESYISGKRKKLEREEDKRSPIHKCPEPRERDKQRETVESGKINNFATDMGNLQSIITENCDEEDHEKDLISKMLVGISIFFRILIRTCACMHACVFRLDPDVDTNECQNIGVIYL